MLLDKGIHPIRISDGFETACNIAVENLKNIAEKVCAFVVVLGVGGLT